MVSKTIQGIFDRYLLCFMDCHWFNDHYISSLCGCISLQETFFVGKNKLYRYRAKPPAVFRNSQAVRKCHQCTQKPHTLCQGTSGTQHPWVPLPSSGRNWLLLFQCTLKMRRAKVSYKTMIDKLT